jgi:hypothetical protein
MQNDEQFRSMINRRKMGEIKQVKMNLVYNTKSFKPAFSVCRLNRPNIRSQTEFELIAEL